MKSTLPAIEPEDYADGSIIIETAPGMLANYVALRCRNVPGRIALTRIYGQAQATDGRAEARVAVLEGTEAFGRLFEAYVYAGCTDGWGWGEKIAAWSLREIAHDTRERAPARVSAMKELNVLHNLTIVDDKGNTRSGRSLEEFYRLEGKPKGHKENPHTLPPDIEATPEAPEPSPPDTAMPKAPDAIPPAHQQFIADVLEPVKPRPVAARPAFEGLRAVKG